MSSPEGEVIDFESSRAAQKLEQELVKWANEQFKSIKNARTITERQWYLNLAFFFGKQNVIPLRTTNRLTVPGAPYYRSRPVINKIRPTIRTELAQLTSNKPNASIVPASAEDRDMYAALAGEQIWNNEYIDKKLKAVIRRAMWWTLVCGTGFIKSYWDEAAGPVGEVPTFNIQTGAVEVKKQPMGDIQYIHETPFHIFAPDLREEELENQPFVIHAQTKSPDFVKMRFGDKVNVTATNSSNELLEDSFLNMMGTQSLDKQNAVLILECWLKPGALPHVPEGGMYTVINNKIVQSQMGWPYTHGKFPFAKFDHIPSGKFYSTSVIEDLIPLQKEYNRTRGQIIEAKNRMAKPQLAAVRGSVDASKITTEPGLLIEYTPGLEPPQPIPLTPLPQYVIQELDRIQADWDDISGQHEVSHGQAPPGVTAATAISYLQERDESKLSHTYDSLEEGIEKIARMALSYVKEFWTEQRVVKVTGPDGSFDAMAFKGSDLGDNTDIRVEAGSALPVSKAAKQAWIMDLMKMGFIDPQKGLEIMEMGGVNKLYEQIQIDQRQAQRENLRMSKVTEEDLMQYQQQNMQMLEQDPAHFGIDPESGGPMVPIIIPVNTWDNHKAHIQYHNDFRKGQAFEQLPEHVKVLMEEHVNMHINSMGVETETMDPRASVGLPPKMDLEGEEAEEQSEQKEQPGPEAMPETETV